MIPQTSDLECQDYLNNELKYKSQVPASGGICEGELKTIVKFLKIEAGNLEQNYTSEIPICDLCLNRLETIVKLLRQYKNEEKALED